MTNEEKLELLKQHGGTIHGPHIETVSIPVENFIAYTSAIEEKYQNELYVEARLFEQELQKYQAQIAKIRTAWHINMLRLYPEKSHEEIAKAIEAVSGKSALDAFIAEVKAWALEEAANKIFMPENGWGEWSIQHAHRDLLELAAELRNQAQAEGKEEK